MVYIDIDDVLADLYGYILSKDPNCIKNKSFCKVIVENYKECFLVSKVIEKNLSLLKGEYRLLSSLPGISSILKYTTIDKIDEIVLTMRENKLKFAESIGVRRENVIILNSSKEKYLFAKGNTLYDDFQRNIDEWKAHGGIGILVI